MLVRAHTLLRRTTVQFTVLAPLESHTLSNETAVHITTPVPGYTHTSRLLIA